MIGRRNTKMPTPAGMVSSAVIRTPSDACSTNAGRSLRATARAISGWNVVAIETASRPCGQHEERERGEVGGRVAGPRLGEVADHDERDLVGGDETDRPERQPEEPTDRRMAELEHRAEAEPGANMAGMSTTAIDAMPSVAPSPSVYLQPVVAEHVVEHPVGRAGIRQRQQRGDDDHVRQDRAPRRGEEPAPAVEERVRQADEPVEQDLDQEDPRQRRADGAEHVGVDAVGPTWIA